MSDIDNVLARVLRHDVIWCDNLPSPFPILVRPWCTVYLDKITNLPPSHYHEAILVVVDRLTTQALFIPTTNSIAAADMATLFLQHVVRNHGPPETLVSDRDPVFTSYFWRRVESGRTALWHSIPNRRTTLC